MKECTSKLIAAQQLFREKHDAFITAKANTKDLDMPAEILKVKEE